MKTDWDYMLMLKSFICKLQEYIHMYTMFYTLKAVLCPMHSCASLFDMASKLNTDLYQFYHWQEYFMFFILNIPLKIKKFKNWMNQNLIGQLKKNQNFQFSCRWYYKTTIKHKPVVMATHLYVDCLLFTKLFLDTLDTQMFLF